MKQAVFINGQPIHFDVEPEDTRTMVMSKMVAAINNSADTLAMARVDKDNPNLITVYTVGGTA